MIKDRAAPASTPETRPGLRGFIRRTVLAKLTKPDEWHKEAANYAAQNKLAKAIEVNAAGRSCFPRNRELLVQAATLAFADRDFDRAGELWRSVESQHPDLVTAYEVQMNLARKAKDQQEAERIIDAAERNLADSGKKLRLLADLASTRIAMTLKTNWNSDWIDAFKEALSAHLQGVPPKTEDRFLAMANPIHMSSPVRIRLIKDLINRGFFASAEELI